MKQYIAYLAFGIFLVGGTLTAYAQSAPSSIEQQTPEAAIKMNMAALQNSTQLTSQEVQKVYEILIDIEKKEQSIKETMTNASQRENALAQLKVDTKTALLTVLSEDEYENYITHLEQQ